MVVFLRLYSARNTPLHHGLEKVLMVSEKKIKTIAVRLKRIQKVRKHLAGLENVNEISHLLVKLIFYLR